LWLLKNRRVISRWERQSLVWRDDCAIAELRRSASGALIELRKWCDWRQHLICASYGVIL